MESADKKNEQKKRRLDVTVDEDVYQRIKYLALMTGKKVDTVVSNLVLTNLPEVPKHEDPNVDTFKEWMAEHGPRLREIFLNAGWSESELDRIIESMEEGEMRLNFCNSPEQNAAREERKWREWEREQARPRKISRYCFKINVP